MSENPTLAERPTLTRAELWESIMRENNQALFRVARSIVREDAEAEDVVQSAYIAAFDKLDQFAARASLAAWLRKIVANRAIDRLRQRARERRLSQDHRDVDEMNRNSSEATTTPEQAAVNRELRSVLEQAIDGLPDNLRSVFVMRDVQGMSGADTADTLGIEEGAVRVRLHRARQQLRDRLGEVADSHVDQAFAFDGERCDRIVERTLRALASFER